MTSGQDTDFARRRFSDAALVLPFAGAFLLMPPFISVFVADIHIAGIPLIIVYLFAVWFALIAIAGRLAGPLRETMQTDPAETGAGELPEA